ncbi:MAG: hypothetical protein IT275_10910 [Chitinophagales bacterium]|nr:hypothetical protein [Chitinophagales bacterium]HMW13238.1 hypothetical protein [Chitinophagales bacterium]HMZ34569.1 hypothetical protein [Chitinophagales bacterium]HNC72628.1 hypothetical protein [Chitinophagales bacterium]HNF52129.1 hypothetical protein [Chitinophagales bacterium]
MKIKSLLLISTFIFLHLSCSKDEALNKFKFTSIRGVKTGSTAVVNFVWSDAQNTEWNVEVKNPDGTTRTVFTTAGTEGVINNLGLDTTYVFGVTGGTKTSQNGSFNARIGTTGDVLIHDVKP